MEKLRIEEFEVHKKKILGIISEFEKAEDEVPEEKQKQMLTEYEDTIRTILSYDLSDIPASMWEGMYITNTDNLEINFTGTIPYNVIPYIDGVKLDYNDYSYENGILKINNVNGNVIIKYREKVYLTVLAENAYFKESTYLTKIKTIQFK